MKPSKDLPLRTGVGIILLNRKNKVFVGKRKDNPGNKWQMPQGGVDEGEDYLTAMKRELLEETSIKNIKILKKIDKIYEYELPANLIGVIWKGKFRGQKQKWFITKFLGKDEEMYQEFMDINAMMEKHEYLQDFSMKTPYDMAKTMAVYSAFTEGVQLFSSFAILLNYPRHNLMKGMGQIVTWSIRDESLHVEGLSKLFRTFMQENPELWTDKLKYEIYCAAEKTVELEDNFIDICFDKADVPDLTAKEVKEYIRYIADRRLLGIGMKKIFHSTENPLPWIDMQVNAVEHTNFFENRATEYAKASTQGNWQDIFK